MAVKVEDGTGVSGANSYIATAFVTTYLTDRNRETENSWSTALTAAQDGAVVAATDFIEQRWGERFLGSKEFRDISAARATLTFTGQPADTETVVIGGTTYTFNTVLGGANSVLIGASVEASISNLFNAILATATAAGVTHGVGTVAHTTVTAVEGVGDTLIAEAKEKGTAGNGIATTDTVANATWSSVTLIGGGDVTVPQPLSFPRLNLLDRDGLSVRGIPLKLQQATAEYAVRALSAALMPDPTIDATGRTINRKREKVGPIEVETQFEEGGSLSQLIRPYPAADRLLSEYVASTGRIVRG
jgi:hypothetical protein